MHDAPVDARPGYLLNKLQQPKKQNKKLSVWFHGMPVAQAPAASPDSDRNLSQTRDTITISAAHPGSQAPPGCWAPPGCEARIHPGSPQIRRCAVNLPIHVIETEHCECCKLGRAPSCNHDSGGTAVWDHVHAPGQLGKVGRLR